MRTVKRKAVVLNRDKMAAFRALCKAYAKEKNYWLSVLEDWRFQGLLT